MEIEVKMAPPKPPPSGEVVVGFSDDGIPELGDGIAALSPKKAKKLKEYILFLKNNQ